MAVNQIELAEAVAHLRTQLQAAIKEGEGQELRFVLQEINVELKCSLTREAGVSGGVKFWVVDAKTKGTLGDETVQTIRLKLTPAGKDGGQTLLSDIDEVK
ncbi:MAG: trypco2 family protein [bacterium]